jgi:NDP-sugar pyrophosphorylase family protein
MKALILAAGYGTRLSPLTSYLPKPLMPIVGKPLLWHILNKLKHSGITDAGVNLHHHADKVKEFLITKDLEIDIAFSYEPEILGVAGGIGGFRDFLQHEDCFMIHNGDVLSTIPIDLMAAEYQKNRALVTMVVHDYPQYNNVAIADDGTICDIRDTLKHDTVARKLAYTGIAFMSTKILPFIPKHGPCDLIPLCLDLIRTGEHRIDTIIAEGCEWRDIGMVKSYFEAHRDILLYRKPLISASLIPADGRYCDETAVVGEGVRLRGFVSAGRRCVLNKNSSLENVILWDDVIIAEGAHIKDAILGREFQVYAD